MSEDFKNGEVGYENFDQLQLTMDDGKEIVLEMTVTISKHVTEVFRQNKVNCREFLERISSGSYRVDEVGGTYRLTGSYEGIKRIRMVLIKKLETFAASEQRQPKANSLQNTKDTEQRVSTHKKRDDVGGDDVRTTLSTSLKSVQSDVFDKHSQSAKGELSPEATMEESPLKPKRVRKLKPQTVGGDISVEADVQTGLAESRVDDGKVLDEKTRKLSESDNYVRIEVDRDRHHYLTTHFNDELKKQLPSFHAFEAEEGKHKVAFALDSKEKGGKAIIAKYMSLLGRFHFDIVRVPEGVDGSVLRSLMTSYEDKDSSFVLGEDNKTYKLIGKKKNVDKMKKLIEDHISEQLKPSKDTEGTWKVQNSKRKGKNKASTLSFYMEHGKLNRSESAQSSATKNCSLQVSLFDKTKAPATEAIVRAIDNKMLGFGDAKAAIEFESGKKYKEECHRILNECKSIPVGKTVHTTTTSDFQKKTKIKYIVHVVLEEKKASAASDVVMKDVVYRCLHHAEKTLQTKSITFPHLGGSDYCDIGSFVRGSIEALQSFTSTSQHLQRVCFIVKDSKTLQELEAEFESLVDQQHNSQFTSSSESSYKGNSTSF